MVFVYFGVLLAVGFGIDRYRAWKGSNRKWLITKCILGGMGVFMGFCLFGYVVTVII